MRMDGFPDPKVERHLHPGLVVVVRRRDAYFDRDSLRVGVDVAEVGNALRTPQESDELIAEPRIAKPYEHRISLSHSL